MNRERVQFFIFVVIIVTAFVLVDRFDVFGKENIELWQQWINSLGLLAPVGFTVIYTIGSMLFLPGTIFTLLGGAAFGVFWGSVLSIIASTTGAIAAYWIARKLGKTTVDAFVENKFKRITDYNDQVEKNGFLTVLLLRITPLIPYNGLNFALAYSPVRLRDYALATLIGNAPSIVAYVYLGEAIASLSATNITYAVIGIAVYMLLTWRLAKRLNQPANDKNQPQG